MRKRIKEGPKQELWQLFNVNLTRYGYITLNFRLLISIKAEEDSCHLDSGSALSIICFSVTTTYVSEEISLGFLLTMIRFSGLPGIIQHLVYSRQQERFNFCLSEIHGKKDWMNAGQPRYVVVWSLFKYRITLILYKLDLNKVIWLRLHLWHSHHCIVL